jgi:hypothetical protein
LTAQSTPVFQRLLEARNAKKPVAQQLAAVVVAKPGTPRAAMAKSPFTETAPTGSAHSRLEINQPARPSSEPTRIDPPRATTGDGVPRQITVETTDSIDEKTDVREPRRPVMPLPPQIARPAISVPKSIPSPAATRDSSPSLREVPARDSSPALREVPTRDSSPSLRDTPPTAVDVRDVAKPIATAEPVHDEQRTPGSDLVLPANPLMNLTDESLEGYVDCTLYEETGTFFPAEDDISFEDDGVIAPPAPNGESHAAHSDDAKASASTYPIARGSAPVIPTAAAAADSAPTAQADASVTPPPPSAEAESPSKLPLAPPTRDSTPVPLVPAVPVAASASPVMTPTPRKKPPWLLLGGGAGVLAVAAVIFVITSSSDGGARVTNSPAKAPPAEKKAPVPAAKIETAVAPTEPTPIDNEESPHEEATGDGPPLVGGGPCKAVIRTTPAGSIIRVDNTNVGPSPLTLATGCGKRKIDVVHPRYALGSRVVTLAEGKTESVDVTLTRPQHVLTITSQPPGAQVFLDGRPAGSTPTKLNVLGFVTLKLEIKKTGYAPQSVKHYSKTAQDKVAVRLTKW